MLRFFVVGVTFALLSGCAHQVEITSRTTGLVGHTSVPKGGSSGSMSITIGDKTYTGKWVYVPSGGSVSLMSGMAFSGVHTASLSGLGFGIPMSGNGAVNLASADGSHLHCVFNYSEWSDTGMGECQDDKNEMYDLQITK